MLRRGETDGSAVRARCSASPGPWSSQIVWSAWLLLKLMFLPVRLAIGAVKLVVAVVAGRSVVAMLALAPVVAVVSAARSWSWSSSPPSRSSCSRCCRSCCWRL